ncbi:MAG TPA: hypothetical protein VLW47_08465 [Thermodesulfobacteriota bacterium]|nr:hypothetical protein [Thermodesulfobacteriota bacterium]
MKKRIVIVLVVLALGVPGIICAEDVTHEESLVPTSTNTGLQGPSVLYPKEWYIIEKIPSVKGLAIGVFLFEQGMPIEHIRSVFGKPQESITLDMEEGYYGTILVYPHHHFFFSKAGTLQTIKERNLQAGSTAKPVSTKPMH